VPAPISKKPWRDLTRGATWASLQGPVVSDVLLGAANLARTAPSAEEDWSYPLRLAGQDSRTFGSRHIAIPPFCLPLLGEQEMEGDTFFVRMSSATASKYGLRAGDLVKLTGPAGYCVAKLRIFEGVALNVVAAPLGFGHTAWDEFSRGKGDNIYSIMTVRTEPGSDLAVWADSRVRIAKAY
jgi:menaquinone reductase, molybdopterin-binding-like subunit